MSDILTPEQVAEMREHQLGRDARADEDIIDLCDTVDGLREQLRVGGDNAAAWELDAIEAQASEKHMGEQLQEAQEERDIHKAKTRAYLDIAQVNRRLTDALREAKPALLRAANAITIPGLDFHDQSRADAATLRALAEMGESDG